ncbi:hypothetical protein [Mycobacterium uberis]|uniref:hypothetical protein n=1 Tax=Mycobacterium uberis TaxID=2162698 RepID=UPI001403DED3|nr:hypothetical protein [Mycobacterium uberis]
MVASLWLPVVAVVWGVGLIVRVVTGQVFGLVDSLIEHTTVQPFGQASQVMQRMAGRHP